MIYHQKKLSIRLERAIAYLFKINDLNPEINHFKGVDLFEKKTNTFFELKSCYNYRYRSLKNKIIRIGVFVIDLNQINITDYYIFIQIINKRNNIDFIKSFKIYVIKTNEIIKYINKYNINTNSGQIWISIKQVNKIPKQNIIDFLKNYLKLNYE